MIGRLLRLVVLIQLILPMPSHAWSEAVSNGVNWLKVNQGADGSWSSTQSSTTDYYATVSVLDSLAGFGETTSTAYTNGVNWVSNVLVDGTTYLAPRVKAVAPSGADTTTDLNKLLSFFNAGLGWGGDAGYSTTIFHTAVGLQAVRATTYSDPTVIYPSLTYLTQAQNSDGGWGFCAGDGSNVYMTAIVTATLEQFPQVSTIAAAIGKASNYLIANQNLDGGFGGSESSVYETSLVYIALAGNGKTQSSLLQNAVGFLTSTQSSDGSWNQDPYSTALAIKALFFSDNKPSPPPPPPAAGTITGTVIDAVTKAKVSGVAVVLGSDSLVSATTDASGNFTLPDVPAGAQIVNLSLSGYASKSVSASVTVGTVTSLGTIPVLSSYSTGTIQGTITDPTGAPLSGVAISVSGAWSGSATTGADGTFSFTYVTPGNVTLTAAKSGYQTFIGQGAVYARTTLTMSPRLSTTPPQGTTGTLVGRVVDSYWGVPIGHLPEEPGVKVKVAGLSVSPDDNGYFTIAGLAPNVYQVVIGMNGFATQTVRTAIMPGVTSDVGTIRLEMSVSKMALTGSVTDVFTGAPIVGAAVNIEGSDLAGSSDSTGFYAIAGIPCSSQVTLKVAAPGYVGKSYLVGPAPWTQTLDATLIPVVPQASITGTVTDAATSQPLPGVTLALADDPSVTVTSKADGTFTFNSLQKGVHQISLSLDGYTPRTLTTAVVSGVLTNVGKIPLAVDQLPASIQGTVWDAAAKAPFAGVAMQVSGTGSWQTTSASDGTYKVDNVTPGTVTVETGAVPKSNYFGAGFTGDLAAGGVLVFNPSLTTTLQAVATIAVVTDHPVYLKGDDVGIEVDLLNTVGEEYSGTLHVRVTDPSGATVYESNQAQTLSSDSTASANLSFTLPSSTAVGRYLIFAELYDEDGVTLGGGGKYFGVATSQVSVAPALPTVLTTGDNTIAFNLVNAGGAAVSSGKLNLGLVDPDGQTVWTGSPTFTLDVGESKTVTANMSLPGLKFGTYTFVYAEADESATGQATQVSLTNSLAISGLFDNNSHRVRQTAGLTVTVQNTGVFSIDTAGAGIPVTVSVPDAGYTETKILAVVPAAGSPAGSSLLYSFAIPATMPPGYHPGTVTVTLPSGSTVAQTIGIAIQDVSLSLSPVQGTFNAGGTITPVIANNGGVDGSLQYKLSLYDGRSALIAQRNDVATVAAGSSVPLSLAIPSGAVDGAYNLVVDYQDTKVGKWESSQNSITVSGLKAALQVQTDKNSYLLSESVTGLGTVTNTGNMPMADGNLHLQVTAGVGTQRQKTWTTQADFQTGVRNGVDTYGINDWIIPDDAFNGTAIDSNKWTIAGTVSMQSGKLLVDTTPAPNVSGLYSKWKLEGDFDVQVDFSSNNSTSWTGATFSVGCNGAYVAIGNSQAAAYSTQFSVNNVQMSYASSGTAASSGRFRITRAASTVTVYYWGGTSWIKLNTINSGVMASPCQLNLYIYRDPNYPGATAAFSNLTVNSGHIQIQSQTVDSVRLLPINDNFSNTAINEDRWGNYLSAKAVAGAGAVHLSSNRSAPDCGLYHKVPLSGDFQAFVKYSNFSVSPSLTALARLIFYANFDGASLYINRASSDATRAGGQFLSGLYSFNNQYYMGYDTPYTANSGSLRLIKTNDVGSDDYWNGTGWQSTLSGSGLPNRPATISVFTSTQQGMPTIAVDINSFSTNKGTYATAGTLNLKQDAGETVTWSSLSWNSSVPVGTSIKFRTRTSESSEGLATATWSDYITASGSRITSPAARWIEIETTLATNNSSVTPLLNDLTVGYQVSPGQVLWQTDLPISQAAEVPVALTDTIGALGVAGKLYLQGTLTSYTGQTVAVAEYPFYVEQGNIQLLLAPDKKIYKPGETVTVSGAVQNAGSVAGTGLSLQVQDTTAGGTLYRETFDLPAGGSHPFSFTTTAGGIGVYALSATVTQNGATLAAISDQYQAGSSALSATLSAPDSAGSDPFGVAVSVTNSGSLDATTQMRITDDSGKVIGDETITLAAGDNRVLTYPLSIVGTTTYTAVFSGDLTQTLTKTVRYDTPPPAATSTVTLSSKVTADKVSYNPNEQVTLTATVSATAAMENLSALVNVANSQGQGVYSTSHAIPFLNQGQVVSFKNYWNTASFPADAYTVTLQVMDGSGNVVGKATCPLAIVSPMKASALLRAQLSLGKQNLLSGEPLAVSWGLTNAGNVNLANVPVSIRVVGVADEAIYDTVADSASLAVGTSSTGSTSIDTTSYPAKDYLVVLSATVGGVEETLAGSYFRIEGVPSMPALSAPADGTDVDSLTPTLSVSDASDPNNDALRYQFEVYRDSGLTAGVASGMVSETAGTTSWTPPQPLEENATYYWRARSYDGQLYSPWMAPVSFRVNTVNDPPTAPTVSSPADGGSVAVLTPALTVRNATDPDSTGLTYDFEIARDADFTQTVASESGIAGGDGATSWTVPVALDENGTYYWRARADDWLVQGPWSQPARLFVNTANDAPSAPVILTPQAGSTVAALAADVAIGNSTDPDSTTLTYFFETDTVPSFDSPDVMRSGSVAQGDGTTTWHVSGLKDNTHYYVRVKASDGLAESPWSKVSGFFANTVNDPPTAPTPANPSNGAGVTVFTPVLEVRDSTDADGDALSYEFEIYTDSALQNQVARSGSVTEAAQVTGWQVPVALVENHSYYWRARAFDGALYSDWTPLGSFMVNTANDAPCAPALSAPAQGSVVATLTPRLSVVNATDPEGDSLSYDFEIYSGGALVASGTGVAGDASGTTSWSPETPLHDDTQYQWRARAFDGESYGPWMSMAGFTVHLPQTNIAATVNFDPDTLSRTSNGTWVSVYIELPAGYKPSDIDVASIRLQGSVPAEIRPVAIGDHDKDGIPDLMVKFKRSLALGVIPDGNRVPVQVTGKVGDVTFEGVDFIRVTK